MDWHGRMLIGAVENGELIGLAEAVLTEAVVEIAVSVDGAHQGHGLGGRLVELAQRAAAMLGATSAILYFEIDNPRIPRIARHLGGKVDVSTEEALLSVPAAKPFAWWSELFESAAALAECKIESASEMTRTAATPVPSEALGIPLATTAD